MLAGKIFWRRIRSNFAVVCKRVRLKFPLPEKYATAGAIGEALLFNELIVEFSKSRQCGLTEAMNSINTPSCDDAVVSDLRQLMASIDAAVALAYGWSDLDTTYDFRGFSGGSANDPWRWAL